ncbi:VOC family protein [Sulfuricaulis sp.]
MPRVVHFELPADDPQRAVAFYEKAFGWTITKWEGPFDY